MSHEDRVRSLEVLGFGTASSVSSDNYPLGGYSGFEVGLTLNLLPLDPIFQLGDTTPEQDIFKYPTLNIGKGVYNNIDLFIHFIPFTEGTGLSEYGGFVRWGFYQMAYLPISYSLVLGANSTNINNQLITKNISYDLIMGITTESLYVYLGGGQIISQGDFSGAGVMGITDSGNLEKHQIRSSHLLAGFGIRFGPVFLNTHFDYYKDPSYALKLGINY